MGTDAISPLRQRMIEDMSARKLNPHTQRSHISSCKRSAAYLKRSPDTATADEIRLSCGSAHYWARKLSWSGSSVRCRPAPMR